MEIPGCQETQRPIYTRWILLVEFSKFQVAIRHIDRIEYLFRIIYKGSLWTAVKEKVGASSKDDKEKEHKEQFTALVRELASALRTNYKNLTLSILPHVNATGKG